MHLKSSGLDQCWIKNTALLYVGLKKVLMHKKSHPFISFFFGVLTNNHNHTCNICYQVRLKAQSKAGV